MATTINIQVSKGPKLAIKAIPETTLRQVVFSICDQQHLLNPENYILKMEGSLLDLALPISSTIIPSGETLQLECAEYINVALQLENELTMTQPFELNSTIWDVLLGFEQSSKSLKSTTLKRAGLESENTILRVMMQPTNYGIESYMDDIEGEHPLHSTIDGRVSSQRCQSPLHQSFNLQQQASISTPMMGGRRGSITNIFRDGPGNTGGSSNDGGAGGSGGDAPRQTPTQDISSAMVEASQEIRQLREQQTQEAMTDRVKQLSKTSDNIADKDRFVRSMDFYQPMNGDGAGMGMGMGSSMMMEPERNVPAPAMAPPSPESSSPTPGLHDDIVRQIAQRVSQKLREAVQRGDSATNYHSLLAEEIAKGQLSGVLPISPSDSRKNSAHSIDLEDQAKLMRP
ncbi:hypothetical protein BGX27_000419 [Mortierella sp. AM989]|nr:hypothetical protein BGX27_000419 [Mortierella sp. AM989]